MLGSIISQVVRLKKLILILQRLSWGNVDFKIIRGGYAHYKPFDTLTEDYKAAAKHSI